MQSTVEKTRAAVHTLIQSLDPALIALIGTSRDLEAIVDKQFDWQVRAHRWYAVISRGDHIHAVADIDGQRISLQRYVMKLQYRDRSYDDLKQVSSRTRSRSTAEFPTLNIVLVAKRSCAIGGQSGTPPRSTKG